MEEDNKFETTNVSSLWLRNIYENLKHIENMERLAREGCESIIEYSTIHFRDRLIVIIETQYKNLSMMASELRLVLPDISPVCEGSFITEIEKETGDFINEIREKNKFVAIGFNRINKKITRIGTTQRFWEVLEELVKIRKKLIGKIAPMLFTTKTNNQSDGFNKNSKGKLEK